MISAKTFAENIVYAVSFIGNTPDEASFMRHYLISQIASAIRLARLEAIGVALDLPAGDMRIIEIAERLDR